MNEDKFVYKLVMCEKFEEKENGLFIDFGAEDEVGIFDDKQLCIEILKNNTFDICSTVNYYAYIETICLNSLYFGEIAKDIYKAENMVIMNRDGEKRYNYDCYYEYLKTINKQKHPLE